MKRILSCFALMIVLFSCNSSKQGSPKTTVAAFIEASKTGNIAEVKKYITKSDVSLIEMGENIMARFDPSGAKDMKDKMAKEFKEKTKDAKIDIKDEKVDGDNATVNVTFAYEGKSETRPFSLVKEDGLWKVSLLSTGMKNAGNGSKDGNMDMDSLKKSINEGMKEFNNLDKDSLKKAIESGMQEFNKMDKDSLKKVMDAGMKELDKLKEIKN